MSDGRSGNQFWKLRSRHGRKRLFESPELLWEAACEYFEWCDKNPWIKLDYRGKDVIPVDLPTQRPYTLTGLCLYLDTNDRYLSQFKSGLPEGEKDFSTVITRIESIIRTQKFEGALVGTFNPTIVARELGLKEMVDVSGEMNLGPTKELSQLMHSFVKATNGPGTDTEAFTG